MRTSLLRPIRLGLLCAAAGAPLLAEGPRLGLTAGAAWPCGSTRALYTEASGYTLGAFADWEQSPGHLLRLALDGTFHPHAGDGFQGQSQALTLNYVFVPMLDMRGFHLILGAGGMNIQKKNGGTLQETGTKLAWNAGFGLNLDDRWGLLARYHSLTADGRSLGLVTAGLTFKF